MAGDGFSNVTSLPRHRRSGSQPGVHVVCTAVVMQGSVGSELREPRLTSTAVCEGVSPRGRCLSKIQRGRNLAADIVLTRKQNYGRDASERWSVEPSNGRRLREIKSTVGGDCCTPATGKELPPTLLVTDKQEGRSTLIADWEDVLSFVARRSPHVRPLLRHVCRRGKQAADEADAADPRRPARLRASDFCGTPASLSWAWSQGMPRDRRITAAAAAHGRLGALKWAVRHGCEIDWRSAAAAARAGHLDILIWLSRRGSSWKSGEGAILPNCDTEAKVTAAAARGGCLAVLQWLRMDQRLHWGPRTISEAAAHGHLHVVQWGRRNGCPWDVHAASSAAWGGHLPVLIWLHAHGCPWDRRTTMAAAMAGHPQILKWLAEHSCPGAHDEALRPLHLIRRPWQALAALRT